FHIDVVRYLVTAAGIVSRDVAAPVHADRNDGRLCDTELLEVRPDIRRSIAHTARVPGLVRIVELDQRNALPFPRESRGKVVEPGDLWRGEGWSRGGPPLRGGCAMANTTLPLRRPDAPT